MCDSTDVYFCQIKEFTQDFRHQQILQNLIGFRAKNFLMQVSTVNLFAEWTFLSGNKIYTNARILK